MSRNWIGPFQFVKSAVGIQLRMSSLLSTWTASPTSVWSKSWNPLRVGWQRTASKRGRE